MAYPKTETGVHLDNTDRLIGRDTAGAGAGEEITVGGGIEFTGSGGIQTSAFTGDVTKAAGGTATTIAADSVEPSMLADLTGTGYIYRSTTANAVEEYNASGDGQILVGDGTDIVSVVVSGDVTLANTGAVTIANNAVEEAMIAAGAVSGTEAKEVADNDTGGSPLVVFPIALASGADSNQSITIDDGIEVTDATFVLNGAGTAGSDILIDNGTNAISDTIDVSAGADNAVFRPSTIDNAYSAIAGAGSLRVVWSSTGADFPGARGFIYAVRRA